MGISHFTVIYFKAAQICLIVYIFTKYFTYIMYCKNAHFTNKKKSYCMLRVTTEWVPGGSDANSDPDPIVHVLSAEMLFLNLNRNLIRCWVGRRTRLKIIHENKQTNKTLKHQSIHFNVDFTVALSIFPIFYLPTSPSPPRSSNFPSGILSPEAFSFICVITVLCPNPSESQIISIVPINLFISASLLLFSDTWHVSS